MYVKLCIFVSALFILGCNTSPRQAAQPFVDNSKQDSLILERYHDIAKGVMPINIIENGKQIGQMQVVCFFKKDKNDKISYIDSRVPPHLEANIGGLGIGVGYIDFNQSFEWSCAPEEDSITIDMRIDIGTTEIFDKNYWFFLARTNPNWAHKTPSFLYSTGQKMIQGRLVSVEPEWSSESPYVHITFIYKFDKKTGKFTQKNTETCSENVNKYLAITPDMKYMFQLDSINAHIYNKK